MINMCPKTGRVCELTGCTGCWKDEKQMTNQYALGYKAGLEAAVKVCLEIYGDTERSRIISIVQRDIAAFIAALPVPEVQELATAWPQLLEAAVLAERGRCFAAAMKSAEAAVDKAIELEREACAKVCDGLYKQDRKCSGYDEGWNDGLDAAEQTIRARGEK